MSSVLEGSRRTWDAPTSPVRVLQRALDAAQRWRMPAPAEGLCAIAATSAALASLTRPLEGEGLELQLLTARLHSFGNNRLPKNVPFPPSLLP